jgi:hypothetical protein
MTIQENTIILPMPTVELLEEKEKKWKLMLPLDYRNFLLNYNGGIPNEKSFECNGHNYAVTRFLCILRDFHDTQLGWYDISVVESQIGERLTDNEDLIGVEVLPIVELFAGDYVCLDYRESKDNPTVCVWNHEESEDFSPVTYKASNSFTEFIERLK